MTAKGVDVENHTTFEIYCNNPECNNKPTSGPCRTLKAARGTWNNNNVTYDLFRDEAKSDWWEDVK